MTKHTNTIKAKINLWLIDSASLLLHAKSETHIPFTSWTEGMKKKFLTDIQNDVVKKIIDSPKLQQLHDAVGDSEGLLNQRFNISVDTFERIFIKKTSKGQSRTWNVLCMFLGYDSKADYILQNYVVEEKRETIDELKAPVTNPIKSENDIIETDASGRKQKTENIRETFNGEDHSDEKEFPADKSNAKTFIRKPIIITISITLLFFLGFSLFNQNQLIDWKSDDSIKIIICHKNSDNASLFTLKDSLSALTSRGVIPFEWIVKEKSISNLVEAKKIGKKNNAHLVVYLNDQNFNGKFGYSLHAANTPRIKYLEDISKSFESNKGNQNFNRLLHDYRILLGAIHTHLFHLDRGEYFLQTTSLPEVIQFKTYFKQRGYIYLRNYQCDSALFYCKKALALEPTDVRTLNNLGAIYRRLGQYRKAIDVDFKILSIDSTYHNARGNLAVSYYELDNKDSALLLINDAIRYRPGDTLAFFNRADVYLELEQYQAALKDLEIYLSSKPLDFEHLIIQGACEVRLGNFDDATISLLNAKKHEYENPRLYKYLAELNDSLKNISASLKYRHIQDSLEKKQNIDCRT